MCALKLRPWIVLGLLVGSPLSAHADSPEAIWRDYEQQAQREMADLNRTLESTATPMVAQHIQSGQTREAEVLTQQLRDKLAGAAVKAPAPQFATLFSRYDAARDQKLQPLRATALRRIDLLLRGSDGKKLATLDELARLRARIEGKESPATGSAEPALWTYHSTATSTVVMAILRLHPDGTFEMSTLTEKGRWKAKGDRIDIDIRGQRWRMLIDGDTATLERPDMGTRWLRKKTTES